MAEALPDMPRFSATARQSKDWPVTAAVWAVVVLVSGVFFWILGSLVWNGIGGITWNFLTQAPERAGRAGGIGPILVSTILILLVCAATSLPLGLGTAILLSEFTS